jgi:hypothetical protein
MSDGIPSRKVKGGYFIKKQNFFVKTLDKSVIISYNNYSDEGDNPKREVAR